MQLKRPRRRGRITTALLTSAGTGALLLAPLAGHAAGATPAITDNGATVVYYNGAQLTANVSTGGDMDIATVSYGVQNGPQNTPQLWSSVDNNGNVAVGLPQLSPSTTYSYQWQVYDETTGTTTTGPSGTFTTGSLPTGNPTPIVPPNNPPANGAFSDCGSDPECLADINGVRASQENLQPLVLPTNWSTLSGAEQMFVFTNLERVSRGENPIPNLVNTYDSYVQTAVDTDADPTLPIGNLGIWSGGNATPLGAMYGWMYDDGYNSGNLDCTSPTAAGCWGHRNNVLSNANTYGDPNEMDAIAGTDSSGSASYAAAFWNDNGTPPPAGNVLMTWASEQQYLTNTAAATPPPGETIVSPDNCTSCSPPLQYGGGPVMGADGNPVTVTPIFWVPQGYALPTGTYQPLVDQFLSDAAAASGKTSNALSVATEYSQTVNGATSPIQYKIAYNGDQTDTNPFPTTGNCAVPTGFTVCISDAQMQAELSSYLAANNLPEDVDHFYPIFFPAGVANAFSTSDAYPANYCAYHSYTVEGNGSTVVWGNEPAPTATICNAGQSPNGDSIADSEISTLSHELVESMTDPLVNSWYDGGQNEIGDECAWSFGDPLGSTDTASPQTSEYNQVINGHDYYIQLMFSNADFALGPGHGCVQSEAQAQAAVGGGTVTAAALRSPRTTTGSTGTPKASGTSNVVTVTSQQYAFTGTQASNVDIHVDNASGLPVANDYVRLNLTADTGQTNVCGKLGTVSGFTNAAGDFATIYTAAAENTECTIIASEAATGQFGMTTMYLGKDASLCPKITYNSTPSRLVFGRDSVFGATVNNPGDSIPNSVTQVSITGDDTSRLGVFASEIDLSWRNGNSGNWVKVPLKGATINKGTVTGNLDAMPATFPARTMKNLEFSISVDGAPLVGHLTFGLAVNQVDSANNNCDGMYGSTTSFMLSRR